MAVFWEIRWREHSKPMRPQDAEGKAWVLVQFQA